MDIEKQIEEIFNDGEFIKKILSAENLSDAKLLFQEKGIELSDEQLEDIGECISKCIASDGKMSDSELENISGGAEGSVTYAISRGIGKVISAPFVVLGYALGASPTGFVRGLINGGKETWYDYRALVNDSKSEKESKDDKKSK